MWFLFLGAGANGKTILLNIVELILGEYAKTVPFAMVERTRQRSEAGNGLETLAGKRFVSAREAIEETRLDEARVKMLTGSDTISARPLYKTSFEFQPVLKLFLCCNHKPVVTDASFGFWRRVHVVPFPHCFKGAERDNALGDALKAEAAGILRWMAKAAWSGRNPA